MASLPEKPKELEKPEEKKSKRKIVILWERKDGKTEVPRSLAPPRNVETPDFKLLKSVFRKEDGTSFFQDLRDEITFAIMKWRARNLPRLVCRLGGQEMGDYPCLNQLGMQVMTNFRVGISGIFGNLYETGKHHTPFHRDSYGCEVITLSFGETREMETKTNGGVKSKYSLEDGDIVFFSEKWDSQNFHSIKPDSSTNPRISIVFFCIPFEKLRATIPMAVDPVTGLAIGAISA